MNQEMASSVNNEKSGDPNAYEQLHSTDDITTNMGLPSVCFTNFLKIN